MASKKQPFFNYPVLTNRLADVNFVLAALTNATSLIPSSGEVNRERLVKAVKALRSIEIPAWMEVPEISESLAKAPIRSAKDKMAAVADISNAKIVAEMRVTQYGEALMNIIGMQTALNEKKPLWFETNGFNALTAFDNVVYGWWTAYIDGFFTAAMDAAVYRTRQVGGDTATNIRLLLLVINAAKATTRGSRKTPAPVVESNLTNPTNRKEFLAMLKRSAPSTLTALRRRLPATK